MVLELRFIDRQAFDRYALIPRNPVRHAGIENIGVLEKKLTQIPPRYRNLGRPIRQATCKSAYSCKRADASRLCASSPQKRLTATRKLIGKMADIARPYSYRRGSLTFLTLELVDPAVARHQEAAVPFAVQA